MAHSSMTLLFLCATTFTTLIYPIAALRGIIAEGSKEINQDSHSLPMNLILLPQSDDDGQACLDGSPQAVYFRAGTGDGANKWMVFHQGGGWCTTLEDCANRSHQAHGSSKGSAKTIKGINYLSTYEPMAPLWHNWNHFYMPYCDGASFSGNRDGTVTDPKSNRTIYFRGHRNLAAAMKWTLGNGIVNATDLIVTGSSAGGLATFLHTAEWCHMFKTGNLWSNKTKSDKNINNNTHKKCAGVPDAGFFPDIQFSFSNNTKGPSTNALETLQGGIPGNFARELRWVYKIQNVSVNHECQEYYKGNDPARCMFAEHTTPFIKEPLLVLNSVYDSWQLARELPTGHDNEMVNQLGKLMIDKITKNVLFTNPQSGAFLTACSEHTTWPYWITAGVNGMRAPDVVTKWYTGLDDPTSGKQWIAQDRYPCAECCHNFKPNELAVIATLE